MSAAPVALFAFNRPDHLRRTLDALRRDDLAGRTDLTVFSDGPRRASDEAAVEAVRRIARGLDGFASVRVVEAERNLGLARSVISGVTRMLESHDRLVVLEDDLATAPSFLSFMDRALEAYQTVPRIYSITGYNLPPTSMTIPEHYARDVWLNPRPMCWGWATWRDRWARADWTLAGLREFLRDLDAQRAFDRRCGADMTDMLVKQVQGRVDSWYVRWCFTHFRDDAFAVYPVRSLVDNHGFDGTGVHCSEQDRRYVHAALAWAGPRDLPTDLQVDAELVAAFQRPLNGSRSLQLRRAIKRVVRTARAMYS